MQRLPVSNEVDAAHYLKVCVITLHGKAVLPLKI